MSQLIKMNEQFKQTELWTDSFHVEDHLYGLSQGAKGITTSPTWVSRMMLNEPEERHRPIVQSLFQDHPDYNAAECTWAWILEMGKQRSQCMLPLWEKGKPSQGRFSIQTSILEYNNKDRMVQMAKEVHACGPNMQVKIPATQAGIEAMEEATYLGISVMATCCFTVDQALAVSQALDRGLERRQQEGLDNRMIHPVCAVLLGMQDDWVKQYSETKGIVISPLAYCYAGIAIAKKVAKLFQERQTKTRLLVAYYRHQLHWSEFIGGDLIMTIPVKWQKRFENCKVPIENNMDKPVDHDLLNQLLRLPPFVQAYAENSLKPSQFAEFGPVNLTIHYFTDEYNKAVDKVAHMMLPDPL